MHAHAALEDDSTSMFARVAGDLHTECRWLWVNCAAEMHCSHRAPVALAPLVIRWEP
jgi:hypothetical protein